MPDTGSGGVERSHASREREREGEMERGRASESDKKGARNENDGKRERERVYARIYKVVSRAGMTIRGAGWVNR